MQIRVISGVPRAQRAGVGEDLGQAQGVQVLRELQDQRAHRAVRGSARRWNRRQVDEDQEGGDHQGHVADHLGDEGLAGRQHRALAFVPEADQQVAGERHRRPADDQDHQVGGQHQQRHREDEEVHVAEEARRALVVLHVADRVDVDQQPHPGDHQQHQHRELVDGDVDRDVEVAAAEVQPVPEGGGHRLVAGGRAQDQGEDDQGDREGGPDREGAGQVDEAAAQDRTEQPAERAAREREEQDQPGEQGGGRGAHRCVDLIASSRRGRRRPAPGRC